MHVVAATFGIVIALAAIEHGIGEILQGNVAPPALIFPSWPDSAFLAPLAGEPAMSIIPNLLLTGVLTLAFACALLAWSTVGLSTRFGGAVLMLLAVGLLLVGGGLGPPLMLLILGAATTRIPNPLPWWRPRSPADPPPLISRLWRVALIASVLGYLALLPGIPIAARLAGSLDPSVIGVIGLFAFVTFFLAIIAALARDSYRSGPAGGTAAVAV